MSETQVSAFSHQLKELSTREHQILKMASQGLTDAAISVKLDISVATVATYWSRIREKMGHYNRAELVALSVKNQAGKVVESLREENARLMEQLQEKAQTAANLQANVDLWRTLFDTAPDAILMTDSGGRLRLVNDKFLDLFCYTRAEALKLGVEDLVPDEDREQHVARRGEYEQNPQRRRMGESKVTFAKRKNGELFPMAATLSSIQAKHGLLVTCMIRDISYRFSDSV